MNWHVWSDPTSTLAVAASLACFYGAWRCMDEEANALTDEKAHRWFYGWITCAGLGVWLAAMAVVA